jgi:hypothetical protein
MRVIEMLRQLSGGNSPGSAVKLVRAELLADKRPHGARFDRKGKETELRRDFEGHAAVVRGTARDGGPVQVRLRVERTRRLREHEDFPTEPWSFGGEINFSRQAVTPKTPQGRRLSVIQMLGSSSRCSFSTGDVLSVGLLPSQSQPA